MKIYTFQEICSVEREHVRVYPCGLLEREQLIPVGITMQSRPANRLRE